MLNPELVKFITLSDPSEGTEKHYDTFADQDITVTRTALPDGSLPVRPYSPARALADSLGTFSKMVDNIKEPADFSMDQRIYNPRAKYDKCWRIYVKIEPHKEVKVKPKSDVPSTEKKKATKK